MLLWCLPGFQTSPLYCLWYMQPCFIASFFDIGHPYYGKLTPIETGLPLTSTMRPYCGFKIKAPRDHVFFFSKVDCWPSVVLNTFKWPRMLGSWFSWTRIENWYKYEYFLHTNNFYCFCFICLSQFYFWDYSNSQYDSKKYTKNLTTNMQNLRWIPQKIQAIMAKIKLSKNR